MGVLDDLGLAEADLGALMTDGVERPARRVSGTRRDRNRSLVEGERVVFPDGPLEEADRLSDREEPGWDVAAMEEARRKHERAHRRRTAPVRPPPTFHELGLSRPLTESEEETDDLMEEFAAGALGRVSEVSGV